MVTRYQQINSQIRDTNININSVSTQNSNTDTSHSTSSSVVNKLQQDIDVTKLGQQEFKRQVIIKVKNKFT